MQPQRTIVTAIAAGVVALILTGSASERPQLVQASAEEAPRPGPSRASGTAPMPSTTQTTPPTTATSTTEVAVLPSSTTTTSRPVVTSPPPGPPTTNPTPVATTPPRPCSGHEAAVEARWPQSQWAEACHIIACESGGSSTADNPRSSASGIWQVLDGTWGGYGGYARAKYAPASVQHDFAYHLWTTSGWSPWGCA